MQDSWSPPNGQCGPTDHQRGYLRNEFDVDDIDNDSDDPDFAWDQDVDNSLDKEDDLFIDIIEYPRT